MEHSNRRVPPQPIIDMTPDGQFVSPPRPGIWNYLLRLALFGVALGIVATLFWTMLLLLPLLLLTSVVGFFLLRPHIVKFTARKF